MWWLTVCSCHVTYAFQSESTLYSCLNVKELLARSRCEIWRWKIWVCLVKKNAWITIVSSYLLLFIFVYVLREMGSNREMELRWFQWRLWLMFCIILLCSLASRHWALYKWLVNFGVCTIHKNCACTRSFKNYIFDFLEDYLH